MKNFETRDRGSTVIWTSFWKFINFGRDRLPLVYCALCIASCTLWCTTMTCSMQCNTPPLQSKCVDRGCTPCTSPPFEYRSALKLRWILLLAWKITLVCFFGTTGKTDFNPFLVAIAFLVVHIHDRSRKCASS